MGSTMRLTVVPLREAETDPAVRQQPPDPAVAPHLMDDKLRTARGFLIGIVICLAAWAMAGAVFLWLMI
jgi:hypothetical protein